MLEKNIYDPFTLSIYIASTYLYCKLTVVIIFTLYVSTYVHKELVTLLFLLQPYILVIMGQRPWRAILIYIIVKALHTLHIWRASVKYYSDLWLSSIVMIWNYSLCNCLFSCSDSNCITYSTWTWSYIILEFYEQR